MPMFTFYPCDRDGGSTTFEAIELPDGDHARTEAHRILGRYPSAHYVNVWQGEEKVLRLDREAGPAPCSVG